MKCVCGYEYEAHFDADTYEDVIDKGDDKFVEIEGIFRAIGNDYYRTSYFVNFFACPKCGTIRMEE